MTCPWTKLKLTQGIRAIRATFQNVTPFDFNPITTESITTFIGKSSSKKATGVDGVSAKIIKSCKDTISEPLSTLINFSIANSKFPNRMKEAQVIPVYKKKDPLDKHNYRPISILPYISKLFEKAINTQLCAHFEIMLTHSWVLSGQGWSILSGILSKETGVCSPSPLSPNKRRPSSP